MLIIVSYYFFIKRSALSYSETNFFFNDILITFYINQSIIRGNNWVSLQYGQRNSYLGVQTRIRNFSALSHSFIRNLYYKLSSSSLSKCFPFCYYLNYSWYLYDERFICYIYYMPYSRQFLERARTFPHICIPILFSQS